MQGRHNLAHKNLFELSLTNWANKKYSLYLSKSQTIFEEGIEAISKSLSKILSIVYY